MKVNRILHIPSGYYFDYAYYPDGGKYIKCVLSKNPISHRLDDTDILNYFTNQCKSNKRRLFVNIEDEYMEISISEFCMIRVEV